MLISLRSSLGVLNRNTVLYYIVTADDDLGILKMARRFAFY
jgi:hypothetical protein